MNPKCLIFFSVTVSFLVLGGCNSNTVKDIDGNVYETVNIGKQVWMAENLKTTKYNDGTNIPIVTNYDSWSDLTTPAYCWYNNDINNKKDYGALYNQYVIDSKKICPAGWHVPTYKEWVTLDVYLSDPRISGGKLKEKGITHWKSPNTDATNETGFSALPGGYRSFNGSFNYIKIYGYWWSSTVINRNTYSTQLSYKSGSMDIYINYQANGLSVRCLKN